MGGAKRAEMERHESVDAAISMCIEHGAIEQCDMHEGGYIDSMEFDGDLEGATALTEALLKGDPSRIAVFKNKKDMVECVLEALHSAGVECGACAANAERD